MPGGVDGEAHLLHVGGIVGDLRLGEPGREQAGPQTGAQLGHRQPRAAGERGLLEQHALGVQRHGVEEGGPALVPVVGAPVHEQQAVAAHAGGHLARHHHAEGGLLGAGADALEPAGGAAAGQGLAGAGGVDHHPPARAGAVVEHHRRVPPGRRGHRGHDPAAPHGDRRVGEVHLQRRGVEDDVGVVELVGPLADGHPATAGGGDVGRQVVGQLVRPGAVGVGPGAVGAGVDEQDPQVQRGAGPGEGTTGRAGPGDHDIGDRGRRRGSGHGRVTGRGPPRGGPSPRARRGRPWRGRSTRASRAGSR